MHSSLRICLIGFVALFAELPQVAAQTLIPWNDAQHIPQPLDGNGHGPSVAASFSPFGFPVVIEVDASPHQSDVAPALPVLEVRYGILVGDNRSIEWAVAGAANPVVPRTYDTGSNPTVAMSNVSNMFAIVEAHNGAGGEMFYRVAGSVNECQPPESCLLEAADRQPLGENNLDAQGLNPSIAVSGSTVVVVYNAKGPDNRSASVPLMVRVGQIQDLGSRNARIDWGRPHQYDNGLNPSVSISGRTIVEVHNQNIGPDTGGPLWYTVGKFSDDFSAVVWSQTGAQKVLPPNGGGYNPTVALYGIEPAGAVVEVHNQSVEGGPMSYRIGEVDTAEIPGFVPPIFSGTINWKSDPIPYDRGYNPKVAIVNFPIGPDPTISWGELVAVEIHDQGLGVQAPPMFTVAPWCRLTPWCRLSP